MSYLFQRALLLTFSVFAFLASPAVHATVFVPLQSEGATVASSTQSDCHGCTVQNAGHVIADDLDAFADLFIPHDVGGGASVSVGFPFAVSGARRAGFRIGSSGGIDASVLERMTITTYLDGAEQESGYGGSILRLDLLRDGSGNIYLPTRAPFDSVRFQLEGFVDVSRSVRIYHAYTFTPSERVIVRHIPTLASGARVDHGIGGLLCAPLLPPCDVQDAGNVISEDTESFSRISLPLGIAAAAWVDVHLASEQATRPRAGFLIRNQGGLLDIELLRALTITTYRDGHIQESKTGDSELWLTAPDDLGRQYVLFRALRTFDQLRVTSSGLLNHAVQVDVFHAYMHYSIRVPAGKTEAPSESKTATLERAPLVLHAPAPNPARGRAALTLSADASQEVAVRVFDVTGREVAAPFKGHIRAGESVDIIVDGSRLPSGSYVVQATGERARAVQRLTIVR